LGIVPEQGSHGIWGTYCVFILVTSIFLHREKAIKGYQMIVGVLVSLTSISLTVSREALLVLLVFFACWGIKKSIRIFMLSGLFIFLFFIFNNFSLLSYEGQSSVPLVEKVIYTVRAFDEIGSESNLALRMNTWFQIKELFFVSPSLFLLGCGYNLPLFGKLLSFVASSNHITNFVAMPESLLFFSLCFGGLPALISISVFLFRAILFLWQDSSFFMFGFFSFGVLIANVFSGASLISDLFYCQFLLLLGCFVQYKKRYG